MSPAPSLHESLVPSDENSRARSTTLLKQRTPSWKHPLRITRSTSDKYDDPSSLLKAFRVEQHCTFADYVRAGLAFDNIYTLTRLMLYSMGFLSILLRWLVLVKDGQLARHEQAWYAGVSVAYALIGVCLPLRAWFVANARAVQDIVSLKAQYENRYSDLKNVCSRFWFYRIGSVVLLLLSLCGLAPPLLVWFPSWRLAPPKGTISYCMIFWCFGSLAFSTSIMEESAYRACFVTIHGVIKDIKGIGNEEKIGWGKLTEMVMELDKALGQFWSIQCLGGTWACRVLSFFVLSLIFFGVAIEEEDKYGIGREVCAVVGLLSAAAGSALLLQLGWITTLCIGRSGHGLSIFTTVRSFSHEYLGDEQERYHFQNLLMNMQTSTMGVNICGVLISESLVWLTALRTCVYIPLVLSFTTELIWGWSSSQ